MKLSRTNLIGIKVDPQFIKTTIAIVLSIMIVGGMVLLLGYSQ
ncbi:MAG: hypothetical protein PHP79_06690 [Clostridia bacterium]|nr:hypothetical protein [Clostridia bacterium]MDD4680558.1 hypothetical protein [Clostridia bacterium]